MWMLIWCIASTAAPQMVNFTVGTACVCVQVLQCSLYLSVDIFEVLAKFISRARMVDLSRSSIGRGGYVGFWMCRPLSFCVGDTIFMPFKAHYDIALPVKEFLAGTFTSNSRQRLALPSSSSFVVAGTHSAVLTTETQADGERGASLSQIPDLLPKTWLSFPKGRLWAPTLILDDFEKEYWLT